MSNLKNDLDTFNDFNKFGNQNPSSLSFQKYA